MIWKVCCPRSESYERDAEDRMRPKSAPQAKKKGKARCKAFHFMPYLVKANALKNALDVRCSPFSP